jgi:nicotinamide riboside kinase
MLPPETYVIIGPESTGKTTLCKALAEHYNASWIPEYARTYIEKLPHPYTYDDVLHIAHKQIELEFSFKSESSYLFVDTDLIITKVWLLHVYKKCPEWVDEYLKSTYRRAYLICYPDLPWEFDPVRENPLLREFLFDWYIKEVEKLHIPYLVIKGQDEERTLKAINYMDSNKLM